MSDDGDTTDSISEDATAAFRTGRQRPRPAFIGNYRLVRILGEGGMGVVYEAEQQNPRRPVALKVIRGGPFVAEDAVKLFAREAQVLARLRHPGIAVIHELGRTPEGQHFLAIELVRGKPLNAYLCDRPSPLESRAELEFRLALFRKIGDAVSYAHQRGVIHRDLKPTNIMVSLDVAPASTSAAQNPVPEIKILDFGISRITDADLAAVTMATEAGLIRGTLAYMSPEQARGNPDEIDLRSDVYSLGMILFEMLTGERAYNIDGRPIHDAVRVICEEAPRSISRAGGRRPRLGNDLDLILRTALAKEPARRYQSVATLVADLDRYLEHQPIQARPPSTAYQLRKLIARHRTGFLGASALLVLLVAFAFTMALQAERIALERDRANLESRRANSLREFLSGLFVRSDPLVEPSPNVTVREVLDRGVTSVEAKLSADPVLAGSMMGELGSIYENLGAFDRAVPLLERSLELVRGGGDELAVADAAYRLASVLSEGDRWERAHALVDEALAIRERRLGKNDLRTIGCLVLLGNLHQKKEDREAQEFYREAIHRGVAAGLEDNAEVATARNNLGVLLTRVGHSREAENLYRQALATRERVLGPRHSHVASTLNNLALLYQDEGRLAEAEPVCRRALEIRRQTLPADHPAIGRVLNTLGDLAAAQGRHADAEAAYQQALDIFERKFEPGHSAIATVVFNLARARLAVGKAAEAEILFRRSLAMSEQAAEAGSTDRPETRAYLAAALAAQGRYAEAASLFERAIGECEALGASADKILAVALERYADMLRRAGRAVDADRAAARAAALEATAR